MTRAKAATRSHPTERRSGLGGALADTPDPDRSTDDSPENPTPARKGILRRLRRRGGDGTGPGPEGLTTTWSSGNKVATRAAGALVVAVALAGPLHVGYDLLIAEPPAPVVQESTRDQPKYLSRRLVASEAAVQWVSTWVTATESTRDELAQRWGGGGDLTLPEKASTVTDLRVVNAQASAPGVWSITVTGMVTAPGGDPTRRYYRVPIQVTGNKPRQVSASPQTIPAVVHGPSRVNSVDHGRYGSTLSTTSPVGRAIESFLTTLLTGGQVGRYITPGANITALPQQTAYETATVTSIQAAQTGDSTWQTNPTDGATVEVLVHASVATDEQNPKARRTVTYPLLLTARDGRWEVTSIEPALADSSSERNTTDPTPTPTGENR